MTKRILIAGFACLSVIAVAQSSASKDQTASTAKDVSTGHSSGKTAAPKDIASGQSSGKVASRPAGSPAVLNSNDAASSTPASAPRDMATGRSSGKRQYAPVTIRKVSDDEAAAAPQQQNPKPTGQALNGNKSANDDWTAKTAMPAGSSGQARVAAADVNGDGKADAAINTSHSNIKNASDAASGQTSGERVHQDITISKHRDSAPPK